jgi:uncharacterized protein YbaR (Trm112 family)
MREGKRSHSTRVARADLLKKVFEIDVLECPRCKGRLQIIATVTTQSALKAILECLGLPARSPSLAAAREREQVESSFEA